MAGLEQRVARLERAWRTTHDYHKIMKEGPEIKKTLLQLLRATRLLMREAYPVGVQSELDAALNSVEDDYPSAIAHIAALTLYAHNMKAPLPPAVQSQVLMIQSVAAYQESIDTISRIDAELHRDNYEGAIEVVIDAELLLQAAGAEAPSYFARLKRRAFAMGIQGETRKAIETIDTLGTDYARQLSADQLGQALGDALSHLDTARSYANQGNLALPSQFRNAEQALQNLDTEYLRKKADEAAQQRNRPKVLHGPRPRAKLTAKSA